MPRMVMSGTEDVEAEDAEVEDEAADAETEADLQHEHRAEALDTLATIELKFALLRERVYVEKMEALSWEEALVENGSHPELLHLHSELSRRRDKRIELAARRRSYEIANILKRRRSEESAVWSWWMLARDELQTTMVAETNRKRRKIERDRRASERPQPVFRLPHFPHELFQHEIPIPPSLHEIVNNKSQRSAPSSGRRGKDLPAPLRAYPSLSSLSSREITDDLDYLLNHRWPPEPPPSRYDSFAPPAPPAMGVVLDMSPYGRPPAPGPTPRRRYPPGPSGLQHELDHGSGPFSRPLTPHGAKVNGWMPNSGTSRPGEPMFERDERDREEIELREREMEYLLHKQQREQQQREQQQQQQQQMHYIIQQPQQQLHTPTRSIPHSRSDPHIGPGQGPQLPPPPTHHSSSASGHHHHHVHYHHVHHHHHSSSSAPPPSLPQPPISPLHPYDGPRHVSSRDLEPQRVSAPEIINLPSAPSAPLPPRQWEREREPPSPRHRERERDRDRDREREQRDRDRDRDRDNRDRGRPASGPPPLVPTSE
ncbi:Sds3-like-domain-containing protein [Russula vinacea]|nr:Sds3-like-domain-containing protein [Russula vinacea]